MNADQITALGSAVAAVITAASAILLRWTSKSSKSSRSLRRTLEAALAYIWVLRQQLSSRGITPKAMPKELQAITNEEGDEE